MCPEYSMRPGLKIFGSKIRAAPWTIKILDWVVNDNHWNAVTSGYCASGNERRPQFNTFEQISTKSKIPPQN